ncbi:hypothetical protein ElyMa_004849200 [Elysia marginata]|uniref:Uncharacterized protein n=1 Tax=Elysia marginata TaxID=1093978 RepID=A0AAV4IQM5_9GAST|nr:hypothetical protein ElyMa_004849200 [Elysia marginata]
MWGLGLVVDIRLSVRKVPGSIPCYCQVQNEFSAMSSELKDLITILEGCALTVAHLNLGNKVGLGVEFISETRAQCFIGEYTHVVSEGVCWGKNWRSGRARVPSRARREGGSQVRGFLRSLGAGEAGGRGATDRAGRFRVRFSQRGKGFDVS